jgi:hypothetical protein
MAPSPVVAGLCGGRLEQEASAPKMNTRPAAWAREMQRGNLEDLDMWLILIEALAALCLLVFLVWWIMFSGRRRGERTPPDDPA